MLREPGSLALRVRPRWLRRRTLAAFGAVALGLGLGALWASSPWRYPSGGLLEWSAESALHTARECSTAHYFDECLPDDDAVLGLAPEAYGPSGEASASPEVRAWREHRDVASWRGLVDRYQQDQARYRADSLPDAEIPAAQEVWREIGEVSRLVAQRSLPALRKRVEAVQHSPWARMQSEAGKVPVLVLDLFSSPIGMLWALIFLVYGLLSLAWAARRFHVGIDSEGFHLGPPTGVRTWRFGALQSVALRGDRLVVQERRGPEVVSARLRVGPGLGGLLDGVRARIAAEPDDTGPGVSVHRSPDAVRLDQRPGAWLRRASTVSIAIGLVGLLITGAAALLAYQSSGHAGSWTGRPAAEACSGERLPPLCRAVLPDAFIGLPEPRRWAAHREQELTLMWLEQGGLPALGVGWQGPGPGQLSEAGTEAWLASVRATWRTEGQAWYTAVTQVDEPGATWIAERVRAEQGALAALYAKQWTRPEVVARWDRAELRDRQLREGVPWIFLLEVGPSFGALGLLFLSLVLLPAWYLRRRRVSLAATATGVRLGRRTFAFAEIAGVDIDGRRLTLSLRGGGTVRSRPLLVASAAEPVLHAIRQRVLDDAALTEEHAGREHAASVLGAVRAHRQR